MNKHPSVYIITNKPLGTLYIGVTSNLMTRVWQHQHHLVKGFSNKYNLMRLVYFEMHESMYEAISREKAMKKWNRAWKIELIEEMNPDWDDLYYSLLCGN